MNPKISVIVPTYNAESYLMNAVNSVINQSFGFENIELILIDDNSNDGIRDILNDLSRKYENIKTIF